MGTVQCNVFCQPCQALVLRPLSASTYSSIGYVHALMGDLIEAVEAFHKALGIRRDDTFSTTMLNSVVEQMINDEPPFAGNSEIPKYAVVVKIIPILHFFSSVTKNNVSIICTL
jgi:hypothetical protein